MLYPVALSKQEGREKAIHYLERSFELSEKEMLHDYVELLVDVYLKEGRHDEAFATVKRLTVSMPKHEIIDPDLILSWATELSLATQFERVIDVLTLFLGTINRYCDEEKRAAAYLAFGEGYLFLTEYEKAAFRVI